jgi:hypothetical protein
MRKYFENQLKMTPNIPDDILDKAEFIRVWSGKKLQRNDKIVCAYVLDKNEELKAIYFIERELDDLSNNFIFKDWYDDFIPILSFKHQK